MEAAFDRLTKLMDRPRHWASPSADELTFAIRDPNGRARTFGRGTPAFTLVDFQPWRLRLFGLLSSICQVSFAPEAPGTSM